MEELETQHRELQKLHDMYVPAKEHKNVRRTLRKQMEKVEARINDLQEGKVTVERNAKRRCRTCFESEELCDGLCWGFWKHSQSLAQQKKDNVMSMEVEPIIDVKVGDRVTPGPDWNDMRLGSRFYLVSKKSSQNKSTTTKEEGTKCQSPSDIGLNGEDRSVLKVGTIVEIKSWGSGSNELDCVAIIWDENPHFDCAKNGGSCHGRKVCHEQRETNSNQAGKNDGIRQYDIYRWGALARNGKRMYDVRLISS